MASQDAVYATLVMTDSYLPGALVLGHSLRDRGAKARLVACVVLEKLSADTISELKTVYDDILPVQQISNSAPANLYLMNRPDLVSTFTKIELWRQTQYKRIVYLDADMVVLRAPNELLTMNTHFAAVPDVGWPDCFNSGMMVLNPNMADYYALQALARRGISFDGADQGLLNMHFTEWERLSFIYNCTPNANYQYVPAYKHFQSSINMIHFIGADKPWRQGRDHKSNSGVYGELLARWWAVYDKHYRTPKPVNANPRPEPSKVYQHIRGEETRYEDFHKPQPGPQQYQIRRGSGGYQLSQPQPQQPPGIHVSAPPEDRGPVERPFGDHPTIEEQIQSNDYTPTSTQEQRRWSAPHAEWDPARQPPPQSSKPEAANFPTQQYEFTEDRELFEPPSYPEAPKDMWYSVPETKPQPLAEPKAIFPWEERGRPKATRVFPKSREPTPPPPVHEPEVAGQGKSPLEQPTNPAIKRVSEQPRKASLTEAIEKAFAQNTSSKPPQPPVHVFPWEARAPKATRVFHDDQKAPSPPPNTRSLTTDTEGKIVADPMATPATNSTQHPGTWDSLAQQTNKWDEDPDIARFMEAFNKPKRAPVHVMHDSRQTEGGLPVKERRVSLKLTDFPTEIERPSLPVTPAPIKRGTLWGPADDQAVLPVAQGVPRQDQWVPIIKLEELQRNSSLVMLSGEDEPLKSPSPPKRDMPESTSLKQVEEAAMRAHSSGPKTPTKPILKEPHFEVADADNDSLLSPNMIINASTTATGSKSPTRFSPIVLEGEAASERSTYAMENETLPRSTGETVLADFDYSGASRSPVEMRSEEEVLSPKSTTVA